MSRAPASSKVGSAGFTLMETLVMLMLVSMAATIMFQMLDSYRIAQQRIAAQAGNLDRASLFDAWLMDGIHGLTVDPDRPFKGARLEFDGVTLNPQFGPPGAPARIHWRLHETREGGEVSYSEESKTRWTMDLRDFDGTRFAYFDEKGKEHEQWPPAKGVQVALPSAIALVRGDEETERVRLAAVRGPLVQSDTPYTLEIE